MPCANAIKQLRPQNFYPVIADVDAAQYNYCAIEIESKSSNCFSKNLLVDQNPHLNLLQVQFENTKKRPPVHAARLLTIYHRIEHK